MSELKIQGASLRSGHRWMSVDHTWLGNRTPCPSRDRGTFWMPRRVPEETAAYSMGWMPASSISLKTPCSGWHVPLPAFAASSISSLPHKGGAVDVYGADQCGEASYPRPTRSAHPPWTPLRDLWRCRAMLWPCSCPKAYLQLPYALELYALSSQTR